jgi:hypothetical protein
MKKKSNGAPFAATPAVAASDCHAPPSLTGLEAASGTVSPAIAAPLIAAPATVAPLIVSPAINRRSSGGQSK